MAEQVDSSNPVRVNVNFEKTLAALFGEDEGLVDSLRSAFVSTITDDAVKVIKATRRRVPRAVLDYVQDFDAALEPEPAADSTIEDLDPDQRELMEKMQVVIRDKPVPVANLGALLPSKVVARVAAQLMWRFTVNDHTAAWRHWGVRPAADSAHPERTKAEFCRYDEAFNQHVYTQVWVDFLGRKLSDAAIYEEVTGRAPSTQATGSGD